MHYPFAFFICLLLGPLARAQTVGDTVHSTPTLTVLSLTPNSFVHVTYLQAAGFGKVACNGMIYTDGGEALVADAPSDSTVAAELLDWIAETLEAKVTAVVVNHFHDDCVGGLPAFHARGIPSFAQNRTLGLAAGIGNPQPMHGFERELRLRVGEEYVVTRYFGAGHTVDNTVTYVEQERVLFGGCFVKAMGAGEGNLADADVAAWPETVKAVRSAYPRAEYVIPGHGRSGGPELLDFTERLFSR